MQVQYNDENAWISETVSPLQIKLTLHNHVPLTVCVVFPQWFQKAALYLIVWGLLIPRLELFNQPHVSIFPHIAAARLQACSSLHPLCLLLLKAPAALAGSEDHRGTSLFILCGGPHFSLLSCLFIPALSVWVHVCGPGQQFWPQCMLMASDDVKYSWQGLVWDFLF